MENKDKASSPIASALHITPLHSISIADKHMDADVDIDNTVEKFTVLLQALTEANLESEIERKSAETIKTALADVKFTEEVVLAIADILGEEPGYYLFPEQVQALIAKSIERNKKHE